MAAEAEGAAAAAGRAGRRAGPGGGPTRATPWVAIPGRISMSLRAMKLVYKPAVVELTEMVQEQPANGLAGMDPAEICLNMQRICSHI